MSIRETWNQIEVALAARGIPLADVDKAPQGRRCTIRVSQIIGDQEKRGSIAAGVIRISWALEVALIYEVGNDKRLERKIAEDAEDVIAAIYTGASLTNHKFVGGSIDRGRPGVVTNAMRFEFQDQATL